MQPSLDIILCALLRVGLGLSSEFPYTLSEEEWQSLFSMAKQQTVLGVAFDALSRLPAEKRPPRLQVMKLVGPNEAIHGSNRLMNQEAARYTKLFAERGARSVILKGQANARLYPRPLSRQAGDIDIWVPGGYDKVERLLLDMGIITEGKRSYKASRHIGFRNEKGIKKDVLGVPLLSVPEPAEGRRGGLLRHASRLLSTSIFIILRQTLPQRCVWTQ